MPTLDDARVIETITGAEVALTDRMYLYDESGSKVKVITIAQLVAALDALGLAADT
jgi:hypothetical protein